MPDDVPLEMPKRQNRPKERCPRCGTKMRIVKGGGKLCPSCSRNRKRVKQRRARTPQLKPVTILDEPAPFTLVFPAEVKTPNEEPKPVS